MKLLKSSCSPYIYFYLAAVIISMEMFSKQCQERKENTKRKHKIITVVGRFVVFNKYNYIHESISDSDNKFFDVCLSFKAVIFSKAVELDFSSSFLQVLLSLIKGIETP